MSEKQAPDIGLQKMMSGGNKVVLTYNKKEKSYVAMCYNERGDFIAGISATTPFTAIEILSSRMPK